MNEIVRIESDKNLAMLAAAVQQLEAATAAVTELLPEVAASGASPGQIGSVLASAWRANSEFATIGSHAMTGTLSTPLK